MTEQRRLSAVESAVWVEWNLLGDVVSPVKEIALRLGMDAADVAFVVYPVETFGVWSDDQEPDPIA